MGLYPITCPTCTKPFMWFSGNLDQRCQDCQANMNKPMQEQTNSSAIAATISGVITLVPDSQRIAELEKQIKDLKERLVVAESEVSRLHAVVRRKKNK